MYVRQVYTQHTHSNNNDDDNNQHTYTTTPHTPHIIVNAYLKKSYIENHFQHGQLFHMAYVLCEFFPFSWQQSANELKIKISLSRFAFLSLLLMLPFSLSFSLSLSCQFNLNIYNSSIEIQAALSLYISVPPVWRFTLWQIKNKLFRKMYVRKKLEFVERIPFYDEVRIICFSSPLPMSFIYVLFATNNSSNNDNNYNNNKRYVGYFDCFVQYK